MHIIIPIFTIFRMELRKFLLSRKAVLSALLAGPMLILFMLVGIPLLAPSNAGIIVYGQDIDPVVAEGFSQVEFSEDLNHWQEDLLAGRASVAVVAQGKDAGIYYDSSRTSGSTLLSNAHEIAANITLIQASPTEFPEFAQQVDNIHLVDIGKDTDGMEAPLVSMLFMMAMMTFQISIADQAVDALCGEQERGTLDTLRLTGTPLGSILIGKAGFLTLAGLMILALDALAIALGLGGWLRGISFPLNRFWILLLPLSGISALTVGVYLLFSTFFDRTKLAKSYASIPVLLLSLPALASNLAGADGMRFIPIVNLPFLFSAMLRGKSCIGPALGSTAIGFVLALLLLTLAGIRLHRREITS